MTPWTLAAISERAAGLRQGLAVDLAVSGQRLLGEAAYRAAGGPGRRVRRRGAVQGDRSRGAARTGR
jgi:hypothetical protein